MAGLDCSALFCTLLLTSARSRNIMYVNECPKECASWKVRTDSFPCESGKSYHCIRVNTKTNLLAEICIPRRLLIPRDQVLYRNASHQDGCPWMNLSESLENFSYFNCSKKTGCPKTTDEQYPSTTLYKYPACLGGNGGGKNNTEAKRIDKSTVLRTVSTDVAASKAYRKTSGFSYGTITETAQVLNTTPQRQGRKTLHLFALTVGVIILLLMILVCSLLGIGHKIRGKPTQGYVVREESPDNSMDDVEEEEEEDHYDCVDSVAVNDRHCFEHLRCPAAGCSHMTDVTIKEKGNNQTVSIDAKSSTLGSTGGCERTEEKDVDLPDDIGSHI